MPYWLVKSDPETYGLDDLEREGKTVWDGVKNAVALRHIRSIRKGDGVLVYHSGADKAIVGLARAAADPYADPKAHDPKLAVFDLEFIRRVKRPVTLAAIKADPSFAAFDLVRMSRLSVMPVPEPLWKRLLKMAGEG